jgi:hypothetical protein
MTTHPTTKPISGKRGKPRLDFPLFPHATGRWAKKVRGSLRYFWKSADDPSGNPQSGGNRVEADGCS